MGIFSKSYHSEYMPTRKEQCGYCYYLDLYQSKGVKSWCEKNRCYCNLYEKCGSWKDAGRSEMQLREHCTWHVSTMIGELLNLDLNQKPFSNIKKLREILEEDKEKSVMVILYDVYGILIATNLFFDGDREIVAQSMMPILNKVSDLVDEEKIDEAYNLYAEMVVRLYKKYNYSIDQENTKKDDKKLLIRK